MSIARVNSVEFETKEDCDHRLQMVSQERYVNERAECIITIRTSETSILGIAIFADQETADETLADREKVISSSPYKDVFYLEGNVGRFQINKRIY